MVAPRRYWGLCGSSWVAVAALWWWLRGGSGDSDCPSLPAAAPGSPPTRRAGSPLSGHAAARPALPSASPGPAQPPAGGEPPPRAGLLCPFSPPVATLPAAVTCSRGAAGRPVRTARRGRPGRGPPLRAVPPCPQPGVGRGLRRGWNGEWGRSWLGLAVGEEGSLDGQDNGGGMGAGQADGQTDGHAGVGYEDHPSCFPRSSVSGCPPPLVQSGGWVGCSPRGVPGSVPSPQLATALGLLLPHPAGNRRSCARQNRRCRESRSKSLVWCLVAPAVAESSEHAV